MEADSEAGCKSEAITKINALYIIKTMTSQNVIMTEICGSLRARTWNALQATTDKRRVLQ